MLHLNHCCKVLRHHLAEFQIIELVKLLFLQNKKLQRCRHWKFHNHQFNQLKFPHQYNQQLQKLRDNLLLQRFLKLKLNLKLILHHTRNCLLQKIILKKNLKQDSLLQHFQKIKIGFQLLSKIKALKISAFRMKA